LPFVDPLSRDLVGRGRTRDSNVTVRDNSRNALQRPILTTNSAELKGIAYCLGLA